MASSRKELSRLAKEITLENQRSFIAEIAAAYSHDRWHNRSLLEKEIHSVLPELDTNCVLEIGSGGGVILNILQQVSCSAFGVEIVQEMIEYASQQGVCGLCRADGACLPFQENTFTSLFLWGNTLGPIPGAENRRLLLLESRRVLQPNGKLAIHVINRNSSIRRRFAAREYTFRYHARAGSYQSVSRGYNKYYSYRELVLLLKRCGFNRFERISGRRDASLIVLAS